MTTVAQPAPLALSLRHGLRRVPVSQLLVVAALALTAAVVAGLSAGSGSALDAPNRAVSATHRWVIPLVSTVVASLCVGRNRLDDAVWSLATQGVSRRVALVGVATCALALSALISVLVGVGAVVLAYRGLPGMLDDVLTTSWIAASGAIAYASLAILGAAFWRLGRARWAPMVIDFTLGATGGLVALPFPRAHLENLLGGAAVLDISQPSSHIVLLAITLSALLLAAIRVGD